MGRERKAMSKVKAIHVLPNFGLGGAERMVTYLTMDQDSFGGSSVAVG